MLMLLGVRNDEGTSASGAILELVWVHHLTQTPLTSGGGDASGPWSPQFWEGNVTCLCE